MKKLFAMALALCMVFALAACGSGDAGTSPTPNYEGSTPTDLLGPAVSPTPTPDPEPIESLVVNGIDIIRGGQLTGVGYSGFDYADGTLTIEDVTLQGSDAEDALISFSGGDLEIVITGTVTLAADGGAPVISGGEGDALTISGEGTLNATAAETAAIDVSGDVTVGCAVTVTGAPPCAAENVAAAEGYSITANDGTTLTVAAA